MFYNTSMSARKSTRLAASSTYSPLNITSIVDKNVILIEDDEPAAATPSKQPKKSNTTNTNCREDELTSNSSNNNNNDVDTLETFAPKNTDDLALHPKKITELRNWLLHCDAMQRKHPAQICLLTGPSGSSKTAALHVLAKETGYSVMSFSNSNDEQEVRVLGDSYGEADYTRPQLDAFKLFLFGASRFKSLFALREKRLMLVEDFPNVLLSDVKAFEELLAKYVVMGKCPLIFIVADSKSRRLNIAYNLFPDELRQKFSIAHISFNAVADTIMQKAIKRLSKLMSEEFSETYKTPVPSLLDSITLSANGDIRNAMINLHFASLKGVPKLLTEQVTKIKTEPNKRKPKAQFKLKSVGINKTVTMFHALGRVFNPKYSDDKKLVHSPEEISESFEPEPKKFIDFVHANYLPNFGEINDVLQAADDLSWADLMLNEFRDDTVVQIGLNLAIRSVMVTNSEPQKGFRPVHGPKRLKVNVLPELSVTERNLIGVTSGVSTSVYAKDYSTFVKLISNHQ